MNPGGWNCYKALENKKHWSPSYRLQITNSMLIYGPERDRKKEDNPSWFFLHSLALQRRCQGAETPIDLITCFMGYAPDLPGVLWYPAGQTTSQVIWLTSCANKREAPPSLYHSSFPVFINVWAVPEGFSMNIYVRHKQMGKGSWDSQHVAMTIYRKSKAISTVWQHSWNKNLTSRNIE